MRLAWFADDVELDTKALSRICDSRGNPPINPAGIEAIDDHVWASGDLLLLSDPFLKLLGECERERLIAHSRKRWVIAALRQADLWRGKFDLPPSIHWILADASPDQIHSALFLVVNGHAIAPPKGSRGIGGHPAHAGRIAKLDMRECAVMAKLADGRSYSAIAAEFRLSVAEVRALSRRLRGKLALDSRIEAGAYFIRFRDEIIAHRRALIGHQP